MCDSSLLDDTLRRNNKCDDINKLKSAHAIVNLHSLYGFGRSYQNNESDETEFNVKSGKENVVIWGIDQESGVFSCSSDETHFNKLKSTHSIVNLQALDGKCSGNYRNDKPNETVWKLKVNNGKENVAVWKTDQEPGIFSCLPDEANFNRLKSTISLANLQSLYDKYSDNHKNDNTNKIEWKAKVNNSKEKVTDWKKDHEINDFKCFPGETNLVLSDPKVLTWRNKDAYVYTVESGFQYGPQPDLEFVIYIPIDTAVKWIDASDWGKRGKGRRSGEQAEDKLRGKTDGIDAIGKDGKIMRTSQNEEGTFDDDDMRRRFGEGGRPDQDDSGKVGRPGKNDYGRGEKPDGTELSKGGRPDKNENDTVGRQDKDDYGKGGRPDKDDYGKGGRPDGAELGKAEKWEKDKDNKSGRPDKHEYGKRVRLDEDGNGNGGRPDKYKDYKGGKSSEDGIGKEKDEINGDNTTKRSGDGNNARPYSLPEESHEPESDESSSVGRGRYTSNEKQRKKSQPDFSGEDNQDRRPKEKSKTDQLQVGKTSPKKEAEDKTDKEKRKPRKKVVRTNKRTKKTYETDEEDESSEKRKNERKPKNKPKVFYPEFDRASESSIGPEHIHIIERNQHRRRSLRVKPHTIDFHHKTQKHTY